VLDQRKAKLEQLRETLKKEQDINKELAQTWNLYRTQFKKELI